MVGPGVLGDYELRWMLTERGQGLFVFLMRLVGRAEKKDVGGKPGNNTRDQL